VGAVESSAANMILFGRNGAIFLTFEAKALLAVHIQLIAPEKYVTSQSY